MKLNVSFKSLNSKMNTKNSTIQLGGICFHVTHKDIKNVHLSVHPPQGRVTVSAPLRMDLETIRLFSISKLGWIRKQQTKFISQKRESSREYVTRESHYFLGQRYLLKVIEQNTAPKIILKHGTIDLYIPKNASTSQRADIMQSWYRQQLRELIPRYITKFEKLMKVKVGEICIRSMKTKWGTCNQKEKRIWLNTELAKKPIEFIEYVLVHEMVHLLERNHNEKFIAYMDKFFPKWKNLREGLNRSALGHVEWSC